MADTYGLGPYGVTLGGSNPSVRTYGVILSDAGVAQLVERNLAKVDVAGSNPVSRSRNFSLMKSFWSAELM